MAMVMHFAGLLLASCFSILHFLLHLSCLHTEYRKLAILWPNLTYMYSEKSEGIIKANTVLDTY